MLRLPNLPRNSRLWLLALLVLLPTLAHAQAIDRGREADVLRLLLPYVDDGPVGDGVKLARIAIRADAIELEVANPQGQTATLKLTPRPVGDARPGSKSFAMDTPLPPTKPLLDAQLALYNAVKQNDDGTFFAHASALPSKPHASAPAQDPLVAQVLGGVGALLWLLLVALLLSHLVWRRQPFKWLFWLAFALFAAWVRRKVPFAPLHANGHGLEDILIAIDAPDSQAATARYVAQYGPTWLMPLQWLTRLFGQAHDQLAVVASALGGLAAAFGTAAAWRMSRQWLWTALAGALLVFVPVATRVGHSESTFVVAQLLVAIGLWAATHPRLPWQPHERSYLPVNLPLLLVLGLLVLGHPIGIGLGLGLWCVTAALASEHLGFKPPFQVLALVLLLAFVGLQLQMNRDSVAARMTYGAAFHLPVPSLPHHYWLWLQAGYAPRLALVAGMAGLWSMARDATGQKHWIRFAFATLGTLLVVASGLMVTACISDALRYQAPFAPLLAVLIARAGPGLSPTPGGRTLGIALWLGIALGFGGLDVGKRPDAQAQSYLDLRESLREQKGDVWLLAPERTGHERVVVELPAGLLAKGGANVRLLPLDDAKTACQKGLPLPPHAFVWLDHACSALVPEAAQPPCEMLQPFIGETVQEFRVTPLPRLSQDGMAGEFDNYPSLGVDVRLAKAKCP